MHHCNDNCNKACNYGQGLYIWDRLFGTYV